MRTKILFSGIIIISMILIVLLIIFNYGKRENKGKVDENPFPTEEGSEVNPQITSRTDEAEITEYARYQKDIDEHQITNEPDVYLANRTPYQEEVFSMTSELDVEGEGYYMFTVTLLGEDKTAAEERVTDWMLSLGLSQEQIDTLDITYK